MSDRLSDLHSFNKRKSLFSHAFPDETGRSCGINEQNYGDDGERQRHKCTERGGTDRGHYARDLFADFLCASELCVPGVCLPDCR